MWLGISWNIFALVFQNSFFPSAFEYAGDEIDSQFFAMMNVMKVFMFVFAASLSYLFGWIIYRLSSPEIKVEYTGMLPESAEYKTTDPEPLIKRKRKIIITSSCVLTIALGIYYFWPGPMPTGGHSPNIQQLAISGDAIKLSALLKEQPHLANTIREKDSWTPLHGAACNGNTECVKLIIDAGADVNVQSCNQSSALHCAAEYGYTEIVSLLLEAHANPNLKDFKGKTALDWAMWNNHQDSIDILKKYNARTGAELDEAG